MRILPLMIILFISLNLAAQSTNAQGKSEKEKPLLYNPKADVDAEISAAMKKAKAENKHILLQIGGNWCSWCIAFHKFYTSDKALDSLIHQNYVVVHVNHSPENKNLPLLKKLDFPQRFGFPVFVILDEKGARLHTQDSAFLEEGKGYSHKKVSSFLQNWTKTALQPEDYTK